MKTCPFCNSVELATYENITDTKHHVYCLLCKAEGPAGETPQDAIIKWEERSVSYD